MGLFKKKAPSQRSGESKLVHAKRALTFDDVVAEWPLPSHPLEEALPVWQRGLDDYAALPDNDADVSGMRSAVAMISRGLVYELHSPGSLPGRVQESVWDTVAGSFAGRLGPTFEERFSPQDALHMRLGLAVARIGGYHHSRWGGDGTLDRIIENKGFYLVSSMFLGSYSVNLPDWLGAPDDHVSITFTS